MISGRVRASIRRVSKRRKEQRTKNAEQNRLKHAPQTAKQRSQQAAAEKPWQNQQIRKPRR